MHDLAELLHTGKINDFFYKQLEKSLSYLTDDLKDEYINNAKIMTHNGVDSNDGQRIFYYIMEHVPTIILNIVEGTAINEYTLYKLYSEIYSNIKDRPIDSLMNFFKAVVIAAKNIGMRLRPGIDDNLKLSMAYPVGSSGEVIYQPYDISRWMRATGDIYSRAKAGEDQNTAFDAITLGWDKMEKIDYKYWLRFYQEGANNKYKMAGYESDFGFYVPNPIAYNDLKSELPNPIRPQDKYEPPPPKPETDIHSVQDRIETQRNRIISRLNAAEKLLASLEGQFFAGNDQEHMLQLLQDLKRKVQISNKISIKSSLFEDLIYRTGNYLNNLGKKKQANFFYKIAQEAVPEAPPDLLSDLGTTPPDSGAIPPVQAPLPGEIATQPLSQSNEDPTKEAFKKFFALLETGVPDLKEEKINDADDAMITVEAQAAEAPLESPAPEEKPLEVELPEDKPEGEINTDDKIDNSIDQALQHANINDAVLKLENLIALFKRRQITQEMFMIDMILGKLGISAFFPGLSEAERSFLESSNYCLTRLEDILIKLKASENIKADTFVEQELKPIEEQKSPLQQNISSQINDEEAKKERRRNKEEQKAEAPSAQISQELQQPVDIKQNKPLEIER